MKPWSGKPAKRQPVLSDDLDLLLDDLCVNWGFCTRLTGKSLVAKHDPIKASDFAIAVLYSEELDANHPKWRAEIENAFVARYGQRVSSRDYGKT